MADPSPSNSSTEEQPVPPTNSLGHPQPRPAGALAFWTYLTIFVGLLSLLSQRDQHSYFRPFPPDLRLHFSQGKFIEIHPPSHLAYCLFAIDYSPDQFTPDQFTETVLVIPGLACNSFSFRRVLSTLQSHGIRAVAFDPPGAGFSKRPRVPGGFEDAFSKIKENGIFWAFDKMVETGHVPYEEIRARKNFLPYGLAQIANVIKEVVRGMKLGPVHLVIHDSMLASGLNFVASYPSVVRSIMLLDSSAALPAFPSWELSIPIAGRLILEYPSVFSKLMRICCSRSMDMSAVESQRLLLLGKDGRKGVADMAKALNYSFDLREWKELDGGEGDAIPDIMVEQLV